MNALVLRPLALTVAWATLTTAALGQRYPVSDDGATADRPRFSRSTTDATSPDETEYDYFIYHDGVNVHTYDGSSGTIAFSDANPTQVFRDTISALAADGGGAIFVKSGTYVFAELAVSTGSYYVGLTDNLLARGGNRTNLTTDPAASPRMLFFGDELENVTLANLGFEDCSAEAVRLKGGTNVKILGCRFERIQQEAIMTVGAEMDGIWIEGCVVEQCGLASDPSGMPEYKGIALFEASNVFLHHNRVLECAGTGVAVWAASNKVLIEGNVFSFNDQSVIYKQGHGLIVGGNSNDVIVRGNVFEGNGENGLEAASNGPAARYLIANNIAIGNGLHTTGTGMNHPNGIFVSDDKTSHVVVSNNICVDGYGPGIKVGFAGEHQGIIVQGNVCSNNGRGRASPAALFSAGIVLVSPPMGAPPVADEAVIVSGNLVYDNQANQLATQARGIFCDVGVDGVLIAGNRVFGNGDGTGAQQIEFTANPNMKVRRNVGFATEASGSATIVTGASAVTVAHGLDVTPDPNSFQVTPHTDLGSRSFWIDGITTTSFTINVSSSAAGSLQFGWSYAPH